MAVASISWTTALISFTDLHDFFSCPLWRTGNPRRRKLGGGAFEGIMRNYRGELSECTQSNLFVVKNGQVSTPALDAGLLAGITREIVFELGRDEGVPVREAVLRDEDLFDADEVFLTSTTRELLPISRVDDRVIGTAAPDP
jgi:branched-chain amino acid aminotransferase